jgi:hypothetical protein
VLCLREMAPPTLTQCGTRWRAMLPSLGKTYETLTADHPDAKKQMDLVRASVVKIGQRVRNSPKMNSSGFRLKQLADRTEADRHTLSKFLNGQLYQLISHVCSNMQGNKR